MDGSVESDKTLRSASRIERIWNAVKNNVQFCAIVISIVLGFIIGVLIHNAVQQSTDPPKQEVVMYIRFPGEIFVRMLRMIILPLTMSSIVVAIAEIDTTSAGKLGRKAFVYYLTTTVCAAILGIVLMKLIKPGEGDHVEEDTNESNQLTALDSFLDLVRHVLEFH